MLSKTKKLQNNMIKYFEKQISRIKNINKPSQISHIIEDIDGELVDKYDEYSRSITGGKYFVTDEEFDTFMKS